MAKHNPVLWFEIPVSDLSRATAFYEQVFNIKLEAQTMGETQMSFFPMQKDAGGATGTLMKSEGYVPSQSGVLIYFSTPDIEAALARAEQHGGKTLKTKTAIGEYGFIGLLLDSEGNRIGLHSTS